MTLRTRPSSAENVHIAGSHSTWFPSRNKVNTLPPIEFQRGRRLGPKAIRFEVRSFDLVERIL